MKLGWMTVNGPEAGAAVQHLEWIADSYLPVSAPVQYAAAAWVEAIPRLQAPIRDRTAWSLRLLRSAIPAESGCRLLEPGGGWAVVLEVPRIHTEEEWVLRLLNEYGVLLQPGFFYEFEREAYLVASLLPTPEVLNSAASAVIQITRPV
jgi:aspartate/methionine/tyrosine aminotransferase